MMFYRLDNFSTGESLLSMEWIIAWFPLFSVLAHHLVWSKRNYDSVDLE